MKTEKGMLLFYDWIEALNCLSGEDFKKMLLAMVEYHKEDTLPPQLEGTAGVIAHFIFPQIRRMKESQEAKARKRKY